MTETTQEIVEFYLKQIRENAEGIQTQVCKTNGICLNPTSANQLCLIPVYEEGYSASLLISANIRTKTTILWAGNQNFEYLPAYYKKYRRDGRLVNEIVVTTQNYCSARFFAAKELMHCFMDNDGYPASNSIPMVNELIESLAAGGLSSVQESPRQTIVDQVAWVGAADYLIPKPWIPLLINVYDEMSAKFPDVNAYLHLAQILRVPELVLRLKLKHLLKNTIK